MEDGPVIPLRLLHTDLVCRKPGALDTEVGRSGQVYYNPTLYVAARPQVGLFPFRRKAAGCVFKCSLRLHAQEALH